MNLVCNTMCDIVEPLSDDSWRVFKNAWFGRFARKKNLPMSWDAVDRAEKGLVDADLGGGVIR